MKLVNMLSLVMILSLALLSCKKKQKAPVNPNPSITEVEGSYKGELPCDDCSGIIEIVKLDMDSTVLVTESKVGKDQAASTQSGNWELKGRKVYVAINNDITIYDLDDDGNLSITMNEKAYTLKRED